MKVSKLVTTLALSALLFTGCGVKNNAIITINDKPITQAEYDKLIDQAIGNSPFAKMGDLKGNKDGFLYLMTEQRVVNQLIIQELLDQEAEARGIKVSGKDVDAAVKKIMDQMGGRGKLVEILKQNGISTAQFKKDVKNQVKMQKLADSAGDIKVTDKDCEAYYKKNPDKFKNPEMVRASHILISANAFQIGEEIKGKSKKEISKDDLKKQVDAVLAEKKELAEKLAKELQADNSKFAQYAKKYSEDPGSAKQGGDLGFFPKERMVPEFSKTAFSIKPNTVSDVVKSEFGYHIIMVQDRREAGITPYEKAKDGIKDYLRSEKQIKALDDLTEAAKKKADIKFMDERYNPEVIQKKLTRQVDDATGGAATKAKERVKKNKK
ncbi:MAG: peptidylprolyl isomerase [Muribaculaceae bacterium]|nr:peptidylprolyl isomerase [Muribaculaceae bacterium]